ncbi:MULTISPECIES: T9SS type A sorting domain-containing protein [Chitinophagaceae]
MKRNLLDKLSVRAKKYFTYAVLACAAVITLGSCTEHNASEWRWRNDDGTASAGGATWLADEHTPITLESLDKNIRLRTSLYTNDKDDGNSDGQYYLQYTVAPLSDIKTNGTTNNNTDPSGTYHWYVVTSDSTTVDGSGQKPPFVIVNSAYVADGTTSTNAATDSLFTSRSGTVWRDDGSQVTNTTGTANKFAAAVFRGSYAGTTTRGTIKVNQYYELEYNLKPTTKIKPDTRYYFRVSYSGSTDGEATGGHLAGGASSTVTTPAIVAYPNLLTDPNVLTGGSLLPVRYASDLTAAKQGSSVVLNWATATEINNKGFNIQRSADGKIFSNIGFVASQAANGTGTKTLSYTYTDAFPLQGKNYYRLGQEDLDGKSTLSGIVSIDVSGADGGLNVYPNPAKGTITVSGLQAGSNVAIYSANGQVVKQFTAATSASQQVDIGSLAAGIYFLTTQSRNGQKATVKFIVR